MSKTAKYQKIERNVALLYTLNFCIGMVFWYGIEKIFITKTLGFGPRDISYMVMMYAGVQVLFNVPSGALADHWSRRGTLSLALSMFMIANVVLGFSHGLAMYLVGTFIWGIYLVCINGTEEAMLYDSLLETDRISEYKKIYGRTQAFFMTGIFISSASSGFIAAHLGLRSAYFLTLIPISIGFLVTRLFTEPSVHKKIVEANFTGHMIDAIKLLKSTKQLKNIVLICLMVFIVMTMFYEYAQLFYIAIFSGDTVRVGIANGVGALSVAAGNLLTKKLRFNGYGFLLIGLFLFLAMAAAPTWFHWLAFLTFGVIFGATMANINELKQNHIPSHIRATASSAISMLCYLLIMPLAYVFSLIAEHHSIFAAYKGVAAISIAYFAFYIWSGRDSLSEETSEPMLVTEVNKL